MQVTPPQGLSGLTSPVEVTLQSLGALSTACDEDQKRWQESKQRLQLTSIECSEPDTQSWVGITPSSTDKETEARRGGQLVRGPTSMH